MSHRILEQSSSNAECFTRIRQASLTVRSSKCNIGYKTIDVTGHLVGEDDVRMEYEKVKINNAEDLTTKKQVRSFLGQANYHGKLCNRRCAADRPHQEGYAQQVLWEPAQKRAFMTLHGLLNSSPMLRLSDLSRQFNLQTDASDIGVDAVLFQQYDNVSFPVA